LNPGTEYLHGLDPEMIRKAILRFLLNHHPPLAVSKTLSMYNAMEDMHTLNLGFFQCLTSIGTSAAPTEPNLCAIFRIKGSTDPKEDARSRHGLDSNSSFFEILDTPLMRGRVLVNVPTDSPPINSNNVNHITCSARKMEADMLEGSA
jgi:hypothetical protein